MKYFNNIVIQGLGFVGAAMAVAVASRLNEKNNPIFNVTGIDLEKGKGQKRIDAINDGIFPFKTKDTKLNDELIHAIFKNKIHQVVFSIDSEDKETYERLRKFSNYEKVLNNV